MKAEDRVKEQQTNRGLFNCALPKIERRSLKTILSQPTLAEQMRRWRLSLELRREREI